MNVANMRATLERVRTRRDEWDQLTVARIERDGAIRMCFAGHAAVLAGDPPNFASCDRPGRTVYSILGRHLFDVANEYLGLVGVWHPLYLAINTFDDLRRHVDRAEYVGSFSWGIRDVVLPELDWFDGTNAVARV